MPLDEAPAAPEPVLPDFGGACLTGVVAGVAPGRLEHAPSWVPQVLDGASQVVLLVLDGLGWEQLQSRREWLPVLAQGQGGWLTSVVPSTTAVALTSLTTGLPPAQHGVVGYRVSCDGRILNVLRWTLDGRDARRQVPAGSFQRHTPLAQAAPAQVAVVTRGEFVSTGFTAAHLGSTRVRGWYAPSGIAVQVRAALDQGSQLVYSYYDGIDRVAHAQGVGDLYDAELRSVDRMVGDLLELLPRGAALAVTADHGQVNVGQNVLVVGQQIMEGVEYFSGEGRFRWLHTRAGATDDVAAAAADTYRGIAWVRTAEDMIDSGWFGGKLANGIRSRLGDVALIPFQPVAFLDPADTGEQRQVARHGSLTKEEMLVPLLAWPPKE